MSNLIIIPRATEKAYGLVGKNVYVFTAPLSANKQEIKEAIEKQYGVTVVTIKTLVQTGKAIRFSKSKRAQPGTTFRKDMKKAYVTLKSGDSIKVFDETPQVEEKK